MEGQQQQLHRHQQQPQRTQALAIVGPQYCLSHPTEYVIKEKRVFLGSDKLIVTDTNDNLYFEVDERQFSLSQKRVLVDAVGRPVLCMKSKIFGYHDTSWVYLGGSTSTGSELFTIKRSSMFQFKPSFDVLLANNHAEQPDFVIRGNFSETTYDISRNNEVVALANHSNPIFGSNKYMVFVYPNIDTAFIISLVVFVHAINEQARRRRQ